MKSSTSGSGAAVRSASTLAFAAAFALVALALGAVLGTPTAHASAAPAPTALSAQSLVAGQLSTQEATDDGWGLKSIYAPEAWDKLKASKLEDAQPVGVAVIDTGFYVNHPDIKDSVVATWNATATNPNLASSPSAVAPPHVLTEQRDKSHGTHIAGIVNAVAGRHLSAEGAPRNAQLVLVRVSDSNGNVTTESLIEAYRYIREHAAEFNIRVINLSIGSKFDAMPAKGSAGDAQLYDEIDAAFDAGIVTVCSAGNWPDTDTVPSGPWVNFPGDYEKVVSVMALKQKQGLRSPYVVEIDTKYSNYNAEGTAPAQAVRNICAPGTEIVSALGEAEYGELYGTSQAAAFVSGTFALVFTAKPGYTAAEAVDRVYATATDLKDTRAGYGEVNALAAVDFGTDAGDPAGPETPGEKTDDPVVTPPTPSGSTDSAGTSSAKDSGPVAQKITLKAKAATVKYAQLKKKAKTIARPFTVKGAKTTLSYAKKSGNAKISVNAKNGKLTLKKGLKKGTYKLKVKVTAAATKSYKKATATVAVTIKVA